MADNNNISGTDWQYDQEDYQGPRWSKEMARPPKWLMGADQATVDKFHGLYDDGVEGNAAAEIQNTVESYRNDPNTPRGAEGQAEQGDANILNRVYGAGGSGGQQGSAGGGGDAQSVVNQWIQQPNAISEKTTGRGDALWDILYQRATRPLDASRTNPEIRQPTDAYAAQEERARRNYISDVAERGGPLANIQGERRMASERMGQRVGGFEANLINQALQAQRQEVMHALNGLQGRQGSAEGLELQQKLASIDAALKQQGLGLQDKSLGLDWQKTLLNNDQFLRQLGLNEWDRTNYWDALNSGLLG